MVNLRKVLITSNGPESNPELDYISRFLFKNSKKILLIPGFSERSDIIVDKIKEKYPKSIVFDLNKDNSYYNDIDGLIFCGGYPDKILINLKSKGFDKILGKITVPVMASSAGSLVIGEKCIITPDEDYPDLLVLQGLKLVPFSVEVHYESSNEKYLKNLDKNIYGIYDGSGIFWDGEIKLIGRVKHLNDFNNRQNN